MDKDM
jgi:hypothetical protein